MKEYHLYIASCKPDGGIAHYLLREGQLEFKGEYSCPSPMYLDVSDNSLMTLLRKPYDDNEKSAILEYTLDSNGQILKSKPLISTEGVVACHLCRYAGEVYVANYLSGSVFCTSGKVDVHLGSGKNPLRQEASHLHFVSPTPDEKFLLAVDLGLDAVYVYDKDLNCHSVAHVPLGHGARHLGFSKDGTTVFCANELASTVTVFHYENGTLEPIETVSALWKPCEENTVAAIRVCGEYVYVSNRGADSISCMHWNGRNLTLKSVTPCGGKSPRDFLIIENLLLCANENSNCVSIFTIDGPVLKQTDICLELDKPVCVVAVDLS